MKPFVLAQKDLRLVTNATEAIDSAPVADFVGDIEEVLIKQENGRNKVPFVLEETRRKGRKGLLLKRGPRWLNEAAAEMNNFWHPQPNYRYVKKSRGMVSPGVNAAVSKGKWSKSMYNRCRKSLERKKASVS